MLLPQPHITSKHVFFYLKAETLFSPSIPYTQSSREPRRDRRSPRYDDPPARCYCQNRRTLWFPVRLLIIPLSEGLHLQLIGAWIGNRFMAVSRLLDKELKDLMDAATAADQQSTTSAAPSPEKSSQTRPDSRQSYKSTSMHPRQVSKDLAVEISN